MGLRDFEPTPIDPDSLKDLSDEELIELHEKLEALHLEEQRLDIVAFAINTEVPGTPSPYSENDRIKLLKRKEEMRREKVSDTEYADADDFEPEEADTEFYPRQLDLAEHHQLMLEVMQALVDEEPVYGPLANGYDGRYADGVIFMLPPGSAKALALDTPIPTPGGWRKMGDLQVGDRVFDENGQPCNVKWVSPIWRNRPVYKVTTDCGDDIIADKDHEWLVRLCGKPRKPPLTKRKDGRGRQPLPNRDDPMSQFKIKETWELHRRRAKRPMIKRAAALDLPEADLPIDPYLLGVWLGDGTSAMMTITSSLEDQPWLRAELGRLGYKTTDRSVPTLFGVSGARAEFVKLGLLNDEFHKVYGRKYIPQIYMRASIEQRLHLLQGLIDTDGTVCKKRGCVTFCNTDRDLAEQVRELVRSLGVKAGWSVAPAMLNGVQHGLSYKVSFYLEGAARLPRKAKLCRDQYRTPNTYIDVVPHGVADTVCIEVDSPSHLFLAGKSMTPTHNSTFMSVVTPAFILGRYSGLDVISTSYAADLARRFGRRVRHIARSERYQRTFGTTVTADNQAVDQWSLDNGSTYKAVGILGGVTGNRADLALIDDPIAGREEAESEIIREKTAQAIKDDVLTRLKPRGKVAMSLTRWHEDDPAGRILGEEWDGQSGLWMGTDKRLWLVLCIPLLADRDDDPLGRPRGALLWPEWFDEKHVEFARAAGERSWNSLQQQRPSASDGNILLKSQWRCWPHGKADMTDEQRQYPERTQPPKLGEFRQTILVYDTALEDDEDDDYSAMTAWVTFETTKKLPQRKMAEEKMQNILLTGAWRKKVPASELLTIVLGHIKFFEPDRVVIEKRASGIQLIQELRKRRPRHQYGEVIIEAWLPPGPVGAKGKRPRAHAASLSLTEGSVWYMPGAIQEAVIKECAAFPNGRNDDWTDTVTCMISYARTTNLLEIAPDALSDQELHDIEEDEVTALAHPKAGYGHNRAKPYTQAARSLYGRR